jgi:hypothetical protein
MRRAMMFRILNKIYTKIFCRWLPFRYPKYLLKKIIHNFRDICIPNNIKTKDDFLKILVALDNNFYNIKSAVILLDDYLRDIVTLSIDINGKTLTVEKYNEGSRYKLIKTKPGFMRDILVIGDIDTIVEWINNVTNLQKVNIYPTRLKEGENYVEEENN